MTKVIAEWITTLSKWLNDKMPNQIKFRGMKFKQNAIQGDNLVPTMFGANSTCTASAPENTQFNK